jgi:hypothetical protein
MTDELVQYSIRGRSKRFFPALKHPDQLWSLCSVRARALSLGLKWLGHEADPSPLSSPKVKNA